MPAAVTAVANVNGYTTSMGNRGAAVKKVSWNTGTYPAGGLTLSRQSFGLRGFDWSGGGVTIGGNYIAVMQVPAGSPSNIKLRLIVLATGVEVATDAALTADGVQIFAVGG